MGHQTRECVNILPFHGTMGHGIWQLVYILQSMGQWDTRQESVCLFCLSYLLLKLLIDMLFFAVVLFVAVALLVALMVQAT
jgi:hypothetical protein